MKRLTQEDFPEIDGRVTETKNISPYLSLTHFFGAKEMPNAYRGSEISLRVDIVNDLRESSLLENLIEYHKFIKEIN